MESTTIVYAKDATPLVYYSDSSSYPTMLNLVTAPSYASQTTNSASITTATMSPNFTLWVPTPVGPGAQHNIAALKQTLGNAATPSTKSINAWFGVNQKHLKIVTDATFSASSSGTLWVPYTATLSTHVDAITLQAELAPTTSATSPASSATSAIPTEQSPSSTIASTTPESPSTMPGSSFGTVTSSTASSTSSSTSSPTSSSNKFDSGDLAGGIVGGIALGVLIAALLAFLVIRRRRNRRRSAPAAGVEGLSSRTTSGDGGYADDAAFPMKSMNVTGWEKHLPQEKDDRSITEAVKSVFEQVQIHVEGFYVASSGMAPGNTMRAVETFPGDNLSTRLPTARNALPLLEGIMTRWIVHRISLRCNSGDSLLPSEYVKIPEKNQWHMENDGHEKVSKEGQFEAFAKWRVLTSYVYPDAKEDQDFHRTLDANVESAIQEFTKTFHPWEAQGKNSANRSESLRDILHQASDTGILLFRQPSTFLFDWSGNGKVTDSSVVIAPALVRKSDQSQKDGSTDRTLIQAKQLDASKL